MRLEEFWLVNPAKSPLSTKATLAPRAARAVAAAAPLIPPPMIRISNVLLAILSILLSLRFIKYLSKSYKPTKISQSEFNFLEFFLHIQLQIF